MSLPGDQEAGQGTSKSGLSSQREEEEAGEEGSDSKRSLQISPVSDCLSMKSGWSIDNRENFNDNITSDRAEKIMSIQISQEKMKAKLKARFELTFEGVAKQGDPRPMKDIFTELCISEHISEGVNNEHELLQIEKTFKKSAPYPRTITYNDVFKPFPEQHNVRTVLTVGIAGIGKTVSVQKFILDWAEGKANQDVHFLFSFEFRDLNLQKDRQWSLMQLLHHYFPELKEITADIFTEFKVAFILDGLDECHFNLDFQDNNRFCDATKPASLDMILTSLIKGDLLPSALVWITSRPAAASQIPPECANRLNQCNLSEECCEDLASVLSSDSPQLRELDLSDNELHDSGVKLLSDGLRNPHCKLEILRLYHCKLTGQCCKLLASVLNSITSNLRQLDLSDNDLEDSEVKLLSDELRNPHCKLKKLRLIQCKLKEECCEVFASAFRSHSSQLRELDLSDNDLQDSGVKLLSVGLRDSHCKLEILRLSGCQVTEAGCASLASALRSNPSHLRELEQSLSGRCYWEVERMTNSRIEVGVTYKGIVRKGDHDNESLLGRNNKSWTLYCCDDVYSRWHDANAIGLPLPASRSLRVGVYLDWETGVLSFYSVASGELTLLHRFTCTFTEPLYAGFWVYTHSAMSLCL
nr:NACHT, LRR and PYD domains-containing protein 3-like [Paramormyrops kingsleyae]